MKKIMFMLVLCVFFGFSSSAFAVTAMPTNGTLMGLALYSPSADVNVYAVATNVAYGVVSKHVGGDKVFKSSNVNPGYDESTGTKGAEVASSECPAAGAAPATP